MLFEKRNSLPANQTQLTQKIVKESDDIEIEEETGKIGHQSLAKPPKSKEEVRKGVLL